MRGNFGLFLTVPLLLALVIAGGVAFWRESPVHLFWYVLTILFVVGCIASCPE